jgi:hypothetical protein
MHTKYRQESLEHLRDLSVLVDDRIFNKQNGHGLKSSGSEYHPVAGWVLFIRYKTIGTVITFSGAMVRTVASLQYGTV